LTACHEHPVLSAPRSIVLWLASPFKERRKKFVSRPTRNLWRFLSFFFHLPLNIAATQTSEFFAAAFRHSTEACFHEKYQSGSQGCSETSVLCGGPFRHLLVLRKFKKKHVSPTDFTLIFFLVLYKFFRPTALHNRCRSCTQRDFSGRLPLDSHQIVRDD
jgi:hypothetical protein